MRFLLKDSTELNELTRFRYDVIVEVGGTNEQFADPAVIDWQQAHLTLAKLEGLLQEHSDSGLLIRAIPDARLAPDVFAMERFAETAEQTVQELRAEIAAADLPAVEPDAVYKFMQAHGWDVQLLAGTTGNFDALCRPAAGKAAYDGQQLVAARGNSWHTYANDPLRGRLARSLESFLRDQIKAGLPEYMMPSAFIFMDEFPLTASGKVDRRKLPAPEWRPQKEYVAPRTATEEKLAAIWKDVLRLERIGIHDDFFALGGHSLLATQVISRVRDQLDAEPELRMLFKHPTIAEFAALLDNAEASVTTASIPRVAHKDGAILSFAQQRLWFLDTLEGGSAAYNMVWPLRLHGKLDTDKMESAFNKLAERHESLRTTFPVKDGEAIQFVADSLRIVLPVSDLQGATEETLDARLRELAAHHFDLAKGPLFGGQVLKLGAEENILVILIHHIISDAWSMDVLYRELMAFYTAALNQQEANLPHLPVQYADFAIWQRKMLGGEEFARQLQYWKGRLSNAPAHTELPTDRPRPPVQTYTGSIISRTVPDQLTRQIRELAQRESTTLFALLETVLAVLLSRYSSQDDIVIGTPIAGRSRSELEGLVGLFLNTLALRTELHGNPSFTSLLKRNSDNIFDAYAHQDIPFEKLVDELQPVRELSHSPIFQVLFTVINPTAGSATLPGLRVEPVEYDYQTAKFDLTLLVNDLPDRLHCSFEYNTDLFDRATIERMHEHLIRLLEGIVVDAQQPIAELPMLGKDERTQLLTDWNATAVDYPADATLDSLLATQAAATPDAEALVCGDTSLSYAELNARANQLAHWLIAQGTQPDDLIGVCMERSVEMVVALLGIVKAGLAYVPFDPDYPAQRLEHMLEDAGIEVLLTQAALQSVLPQHSIPMLLLDQASAELDGQPATNPPARALPGNLAYVIFTSGSTGRPKGVMNEHRGIVNRLLWMQDAYGLTRCGSRAAEDAVQLRRLGVGVLLAAASRRHAGDGPTRRATDPAYLAELIDERAHHDAALRALDAAGVPAGARAPRPAPRSQRVICSGEALSHDAAGALLRAV